MSRDSIGGRVARTFSAVTSQIFRCHGLEHVPPQADDLGGHDLFYWIIFTSALSAWFLFFFAPQRERLEQLRGKREVLAAHLREEKRELARLQRGIADLTRGDPTAWERAARGKLGWTEPGELTDMVAWRHANVLPPRPAPVPAPNAPPVPSPRTQHVMQRPELPALPVAPETVRTAGLRLYPKLPPIPVAPSGPRPVAASRQVPAAPVKKTSANRPGSGLRLAKQ